MKTFRQLREEADKKPKEPTQQDAVKDQLDAAKNEFDQQAQQAKQNAAMQDMQDKFAKQQQDLQQKQQQKRLEQQVKESTIGYNAAHAYCRVCGATTDRSTVTETFLRSHTTCV